MAASRTGARTKRKTTPGTRPKRPKEKGSSTSPTVSSRSRKRSGVERQTAQAGPTSQPTTRRRKKDDGDDFWKLLLGAVAVGGVGYGVLKHMEAEQQATVAQQATMRADEASRQAETAQTRALKLAIEIAHAANTRIAQVRRETAPQLRFEGCHAAATDGILICIDMNWLLTGIVDPAEEPGSISGRIIGSIAHEWFHFLDMARGTRPSHEEELLADAFAGKQLAGLGVPPEHFADLLSRFPQSSTHPAGRLRAKTVIDAHAKQAEKMRS